MHEGVLMCALEGRMNGCMSVRGWVTYLCSVYAAQGLGGGLGSA